MAKSMFIRCENGNYLLIKNITRLFVQADEITRKATVKASTIGPAMPFTVAQYDNKNLAEIALTELIDRIEKGHD